MIDTPIVHWINVTKSLRFIVTRISIKSCRARRRRTDRAIDIFQYKRLRKL